MTPTQVQQQVFSLSWLACMAAKNQWQDTDLQNEMNSIQSHIGNWNVAWGPSYFDTGKNNAAANTMYVAQQLDSNGNPLPVYVVAIAATNSSSMYDITTEDLTINPVDWPYVTASPQPQVTFGDNDGVSHLLALTSAPVGGPESTLQEFLASIPNKNQATLWFTGHSLGGALSPMTMLALMDPASSLNQTPGQNVSLTNWKQANLLATAGPSIGDQNYVTYFDNTLTHASNATTTFIWNAHDVVPHAWDNTTMNQITNPNIYGITFGQHSCVAGAIAKEQANAAQYAYKQFQTTPAFSGTLQSYTGIGIWTADAKFIAQMEYQHINAYVDAFQTTWFTEENLCGEPTKAEEAASALCLMI